MSALLQFSNYLEQTPVRPPYEAPPEGSWLREQPTGPQKPPRPAFRHSVHMNLEVFRVIEVDREMLNREEPHRADSGLITADWQMLNRELSPGFPPRMGQTLGPYRIVEKGLEEVYVIDDRPSVAAFIEENRLRSLLLQARDPLNAAFGEASIKTLTLVHDDEGFTTLYCLVMVSGDMQDARRALKSFDQEWWLARSGQVAGKLNFDFELV